MTTTSYILNKSVDSNYMQTSTVLGGSNDNRYSLRPILNTTTIDRDSAKHIAKMLFQTYDQNKSGAIESYEIKTMIGDAYSMLGKTSSVTNAEAETYLQIHDKDRDGNLSLNDLEDICINYLCGLGGGVSLTKILGAKDRNIRAEGEKGAGLGERNQLIKRLTEELGADVVEGELKHARSIFEKYDIDRNGHLEYYEVEPMMRDTYANLGQYFNPSNDDINHYISMMDTGSDGRISLFDYESFVLKALANRNIKL